MRIEKELQSIYILTDNGFSFAFDRADTGYKLIALLTTHNGAYNKYLCTVVDESTCARVASFVAESLSAEPTPDQFLCAVSDAEIVLGLAKEYTN